MTADLRTPFFEAGFRILGTEGYAGLKQAPLCSSVGVTTGAFYHSFDSWKDFTAQLLGSWLRERTTDLVSVAQEQPDPVERLLLIVQMTTELPHRAEAAIRVWSSLDPEVAAVQREVDAARLAVVQDAFEALGSSEAASYAQLGMALLIGFEQQPATDPEVLRWSLRLVLATATGPRPAVVDPVVS